MISLNEIAALLNKIDAILDEADGDILMVDTEYEGKGKVLIDHTAFLTEFVEFDIEEIDDEQFKFRLLKSIDGIRFSAFVSPAEIAQLETTIPEQFEYISKRLQEE